MAETPVVDREECISGRVCGEVCPEVFRLNDRDVSEVCNPTGAPEERSRKPSTSARCSASLGKEPDEFFP